MFVSRRVLVLVSLVCLSAAVSLRAQVEGDAEPGIILRVEDVDTPGGPSILHEGGLQNGADGFHDREDTTWDTIPSELEGADYIESAQNNADVSDAGGTTLELDVEVEAGTILHMFIDNRLEAAGRVPFPWMTPEVFGSDWVDTGEDITTFFLAEGFSIWSTAEPLPAGTFTFRQQPIDASFYGIAATLGDEPPERECVDLRLSFLDIELTVGKTVRLGVSCLDEEGRAVPMPEIDFESDVDEVATVDASGLITAVDVGETEITASHGDVSASALVTVIESRIRGVPEPGIILSVVDVDTPGGFSILHEGGLTNGANGFHDRDGQTWDVVPAKLIGADYIETSQNNADVTDDRGTTLELAVEVVDGAILHMFIDNRIPAGQLPFPWMNEKVFGVEWFDTGEDVETSYVVQGFSVWSTIDPLEEGVYTFRQQPVDAGFYGIAATAFLEDRPREFHRGDTNDDGDVNLSDAVHVLNWLFLQGDAPTCVDAADVDDDGNVLLTDAVSLLNFLFLQGVPPADPGPPPNECGTDDTAPLGCEAYGSC